MEFTIDELMVVCIARQVKDGDVLAQGLATPLVAAGYLLAWRTHAPNAFFASAIGQSLCRRGAPLRLARAETLWLDRAVNAFGFAAAVLDLMPSVNFKEYFRPGQVDAHGNFDNLAIGRDLRRPRLRLPGVGGIPDVTTYGHGVHLYVPRHSRVTFVPTVARVTGLGHSPHRREGSGPVSMLTDLGLFDYTGGRMRIQTLHTGVSFDQVQSHTGFELAQPPRIEATPEPTPEELQLLRQDIDPLGIRRLEFLSGPERRQALRSLLEEEAALSD
jgi:acyl CoA:acetate/3-ketoacid CoA transferase beta subunit